jgi:hypothetical protein
MLPQAKRRLRRFQIYLGAKFRKKSGQLSSQFAASANRRFKFNKSRQLFIRAHNETFSVIAMRVRDKDRSPARIDGCDAAPTPPSFAEIVSDDFPVFYPGFDSDSFALQTAMTNVRRLSLIGLRSATSRTIASKSLRR